LTVELPVDIKDPRLQIPVKEVVVKTTQDLSPVLPGHAPSRLIIETYTRWGDAFGIVCQ